MSTASAQRNSILMAFGLAGVLELVQLAVNPRDWLWTVSRAFVFVLFVVAVALWIFAAVTERRSRVHGPPEA
jgi:hypothetical protein